MRAGGGSQEEAGESPVVEGVNPRRVERNLAVLGVLQSRVCVLPWGVGVLALGVLAMVMLTRL